MVNERLLGYVRDNLQAGFSRGDIEVALRAAGWEASDIAAAFADANAGAPRRGMAPVNSTQSAINTELQRLEMQRPRRGGQPAAAGGIIGWMIQKRLVSSKQQANIVLIICTILITALALWNFYR